MSRKKRVVYEVPDQLVFEFCGDFKEVKLISCPELGEQIGVVYKGDEENDKESKS